jgi:diketogulonate reductase-like aldo/keto reductase
MIHKQLQNGYTIPVLGTGTNTFGKENRSFQGAINFDTTELKSAIALGYRLLDTAIYYRNEAVIGKAVKDSGIAREEFFITSKIPETTEHNQTDDVVRHTVQSSLKALDLGYIDLYLMHFPLEKDEDNLRVWRVLESFVDQGVIKSIGVSNFSIDQLTYLMKHARIQPVLHQFQSYPGKLNSSMIDFCHAHHIIPEAYHSFAKLSEEVKNVLTTIGQRYGKTWGQVGLRFQLQLGIVVIPKSHNPIHQEQNINVFDFELSKEEQNKIKALS